MRKAVTNWVAAVSTIGSLVALIYGLLGHGPGPSSLWIVIEFGGSVPESPAQR